MSRREEYEMKTEALITPIVHLYRAVDRQKQLVGLLKAYNADTITIENEDGSETDIDRVNVSLVRPTIDF